MKRTYKDITLQEYYDARKEPSFRRAYFVGTLFFVLLSLLTYSPANADFTLVFGMYITITLGLLPGIIILGIISYMAKKTEVFLLASAKSYFLANVFFAVGLLSFIGQSYDIKVQVKVYVCKVIGVFLAVIAFNQYYVRKHKLMKLN